MSSVGCRHLFISDSGCGTSGGGSSWSQGFPAPFLDQILPACTPRGIAHFRTVCKTWRIQCSSHLTHLELPPVPVEEFRSLAATYPNIRSMSISRGRADVSTCWMQTEQIQALTSFTSLESLHIQSVSLLRPQDIRLLESLSALHSLSLPNVDLDWGQINALANSRHITALWPSTLSCVPSRLTGALQLLQISLQSWPNNSHLARDLATVSTLQSLCLHMEVWGGHQGAAAALLALSNLRDVELKALYCEQTADLLLSVCDISSISRIILHTSYKVDLTQTFRPEDWMFRLTSVVSLELSLLNACDVAPVTCMSWLSSLDLSRLRSAPSDNFAFISCLIRLTRLKLSSEYLDHCPCTFLHALANLASCSLHAMSSYSASSGVETVMQHGSAALFCLTELTHLQLYATFPTVVNTLPLSTGLCSLVFKGPGQVPTGCIASIAALTRLTRLKLSADLFPLHLSQISSLRWMKELSLLGAQVSWANIGFVFDLQYLVSLRLVRFLCEDAVFAQATRLGKLTTLDLRVCPRVTTAVFGHLTGLVSLRELRVCGCDRFPSWMNTSTVLTTLHRLKTISICE